MPVYWPRPALVAAWRRVMGLFQQVPKIALPFIFASLVALGWLKRSYDLVDDSRDEERGEGERGDEEETQPPAKLPRVEGGDEEETGPPAKVPRVEVRPDGEEEDYRVPTSDELYCEYDSTWEAEEGQHQARRPLRSYKFDRFRNAARDMQNYRRGYPYGNRRHYEPASYDAKPNLNFYLGKQPSLPDEVYIGEFHTHWYGDYDKLESVHTFIQWLFPLEEPGMNHMARTLTKAEIADFLESPLAKENLLKSYKLMLDFYGIQLCDEETGEVRRAPHWRGRFDNMNRHTHNNLRLTRILKCLGTLGYRHYQAPLVHFFLTETLINGELRNVKDSVLNYFLFAVRDKEERRQLVRFAYMSYKDQDEFVWCPRKIQVLWRRMEESLHSNYSSVDLGDEN